MAGMQTVIRPAAVLPEHAVRLILPALERLDVSAGGVWLTTPTLWQRYNRPWDGPLGSHGTSDLVGSIAVVYGTPTRSSITVYRAAVTDIGVAAGWTTDSLCDEAFSYAGLTLANCPRAALATPPARDPFKDASLTRVPE
ncbi:MAG TPA: hypothetical protein VHX15_03645 [Frankiaceae bacterium]|nr:hypothetical protein [Frankiaceae bacterium]